MIDEGKAGRELDAMIAEKVMGLHKVMELGFDSDGPEHEVWRSKAGHRVSQGNPPPYSTDMTTAWQLVKRLRRKFESVEVVGCDDLETPGDEDDNSDLTYWSCIIGHDENEDQIFASAGTAELAICRAVLKAQSCGVLRGLLV